MTDVLTEAAMAARPTDEELIARAHSIGHIIAANAAEGEQNRRAADESIRAIQEQGLFKLAVPQRYGGYQASMKTMLDVSSAIAEYDGGTSWAMTLITACAWTASLYPTHVQDEIWGENPDARISGVFAPTGTATPVEGGYSVTGRWYYNSGSWFSDWVMVAFPNPDATSRYGSMSFALIPRGDIEIEDTWFTAGMRASASNCIVAEEVFVPAHRVMSANEANLGHILNERADEEPLYRAAFQPLLILIIIGPQLGMGRAAMKYVVEKSTTRGIPGTDIARQADWPAFQQRIAKAALKLSTAELHAYAAAEEIDRDAELGVYPPIEDRIRTTAWAAYVAENVREAIDLLLTAHGAGSFAEASPLQRIWRDANTAGRHAFIAPDARYDLLGRAILGLGSEIKALV